MTGRLQEAIKAVLATPETCCERLGRGDHRCYPVRCEAFKELQIAFRKEIQPPETEQGETD